MFGLSRGQLKNGLILAFVIFLVSQVSKELNQDFEVLEKSNQILPNLKNNERISNLVQQRKNPVQLDKPLVGGKGKKGPNAGPKGENGEKLRKERLELKKQKEELLKERDALTELLWKANIQNIMSGNDEFSPLVQPLPRVYAQDDPELIQIIREKYLIPPSKESYNIKATEDTSMGQAQVVRKILNNKVCAFCHMTTLKVPC